MGLLKGKRCSSPWVALFPLVWPSGVSTLLVDLLTRAIVCAATYQSVTRAQPWCLHTHTQLSHTHSCRPPARGISCSGLGCVSSASSRGAARIGYPLSTWGWVAVAYPVGWRGIQESLCGRNGGLMGLEHQGGNSSRSAPVLTDCTLRPVRVTPAGRLTMLQEESLTRRCCFRVMQSGACTGQISFGLASHACISCMCACAYVCVALLGLPREPHALPGLSTYPLRPCVCILGTMLLSAG